MKPFSCNIAYKEFCTAKAAIRLKKGGFYMLGAIIGDIVGSRFERSSDKTKDFLFFAPSCCPTDDSIMTIAVGLALVEADISDEESFKQVLIERMKELGRLYPDAGYGGRFYTWLLSEDNSPYGSFGNGSGMRVSPVAWAADNIDDVRTLARWSAEVTHDHPEGIKGAEAVASAVFLARKGYQKEEIREYIEKHFYDLDFTVDEIRPSYSFDVTCRGSVPQAIVCFLDSTDYEDAVRNAVSLGGDGDTIGAMAGAVAEAFYGIPPEIEEEGLEFLDDVLSDYYFSYADELYG